MSAKSAPSREMGPRDLCKQRALEIWCKTMSAKSSEEQYVSENYLFSSKSGSGPEIGPRDACKQRDLEIWCRTMSAKSSEEQYVSENGLFHEKWWKMGGIWEASGRHGLPRCPQGGLRGLRLQKMMPLSAKIKIFIKKYEKTKTYSF